MQLKIVAAAFIMAFATNTCGAARILGIFSVPSISHQVVFRALMEELAKRGHEIVVMTPNPVHYKDRQFENITEIDIQELSYKMWKEKMAYVALSLKLNDHRYMMGVFLEVLIELVDAQLSVPKMKAILRNEEEHFDLIFVQNLIKINFAAGTRFKAPVIGVSCLSAMISNFNAVENPTHPILYPDTMATTLGEQNLWERFDNVFGYLYQKYLHSNYSEAFNNISKKHYGTNAPSVEEAERQMSMLFLNAHPILAGIRPVVPAVVYFGGSHVKPKKALPEDLKQLLDESTQGVIYMSLGSNVMSKDLAPHIRNVFIETFGELPYKVLWKWENDTLPGKPSNVVISKWFPQSDLLGHPNIKAFITQGGQQSLQEAIIRKVPLIGIPFVGDQMYNVNKIVELGIGRDLKIEIVNKASLRQTILEVAENATYRESITRLSSVLEDRPETGLERAVWWTEYVIRHKGAHHLKAPTASLYEYFLLEIVVYLALLVIAGVYVFYRISKFLLTCFSSIARLKRE